MKNQFYHRVEVNPIIAAVREYKQIERAIESPCEIIFILKSDICNIKSVVDRVKKTGKQIYLHIDLIEGLGRDTQSIKYIHKNINPDGIITTKTSLVKAAKNLNMFVIQRCFILDHLSLATGIDSIKSVKPDAVELLPGIMPRITNKLIKTTNIPIITGGLIMDKKDILQSLKAGAIGISTSKEEIWYM